MFSMHDTEILGIQKDLHDTMIAKEVALQSRWLS
jgi:hypothetical protein